MELFAESDRRMAEQSAALKQELAERSLDLKQEMAEGAAVLRQEITDLTSAVENLNKRFGDFGNAIGRTIESLVQPSILPALQSGGLPVAEAWPNLRTSDGDVVAEIDALWTGPFIAVVCSIKSRLTRKKVDEAAEQMRTFVGLFPRYREHTIFGLAAGIRVDKGIDRYGSRKGMFLMSVALKIMRILNSTRFRPRDWRLRS